MAWTYSGNPATNSKDKVRWLTGDTRTAEQLASDEEIAYALTQEPNVYLAAALVCEAIAARFARDESVSATGTSFSRGGRATEYQARADSLRKRKRVSKTRPTAGGIEQSEKDTAAADISLVARTFRTGMHDNPAGVLTGTANVDEE